MQPRRGAGKELACAADLTNHIVNGIKGTSAGVPVCRGNWTTREEVLFTGDSARLLPAMGCRVISVFSNTPSRELAIVR